MVSWSLLFDHSWALLLLWTWVVLTGFALLPCVRVRVGLVGAPLVGIVYWTLALYLLPFAGGLDVAAGVIVLLLAIHLVRWCRRPTWMPAWKQISWSTLILVVGSLPYTTTMLYHYVPTGMDGSMHTSAASLIARTRGLPRDYAPYAADVPFPTVNLGLPTVAAVAIRSGGEPAAVMLAAQHLTFTCLILATYLLLRRWTPRTSAAVIAVASVWMARASQASLDWGGYPTVMSIAIGLLAANLVLKHRRSWSWRLSLTTGAVIAAIPLIHGLGGGGWIYCVGPFIALAAFNNARSWTSTLRGLALTGVSAGVLLAVYRMTWSLELQPFEMDITRQAIQIGAPPGIGWRAWPSALAYACRDSGTGIVFAGWLACALLLIRRRWGAASLLVGVGLALTTVIANARWYVLPGSFLLYPDRVIYWSAPVSAVALGMAWRSIPDLCKHSRWVTATAVAVLLWAGYFHNQFYQKIVRENSIDRDGWDALVWAKDHLQPGKHFVDAPYNTAGSYLPSVAQIGCTGSHHHHFVCRQVLQACQRRTYTHRFVDNLKRDPAQPVVGKIVYRNRAITIVELLERSDTTMRGLKQAEETQ